MLKKASTGFTLIELGMVIAAIVVLIAFVTSFIGPASDNAALEVTLDTVEEWTKLSQTTGNRLASYEACENQEPCKYKKWVLPENCPGSAATDQHFYRIDGPCLYDLANPSHREILSGLPNATAYTNKLNNKPFYLIHDAHQVQAFTCVPVSSVAGKAYTKAAVVEGIYATNACKADGTETNALLYHTLSDLTPESARILARRFNEEKTTPGDLPPIVRPPPKPLPPRQGCSQWNSSTR